LGRAFGADFACLNERKKRKEGRGKKHLADEIREGILVLGERDGIFPDALVSTFVGRAGGLELGKSDVFVLLLSQVLVEGEGVVVFFGITLLGERRVGRRMGSGVGGVWRGVLDGINGGVVSGSLLGL